MVNTDTKLRVMAQNDMVRFVYTKGSPDFDVILDDEFSESRTEVRYHNSQFLVYNFNGNNEPILVLAKELEYVRLSDLLKKLVAKFAERLYSGNYQKAEEISLLLSEAERGKVDGKDLQETHTIVYARQVDMGYRYEIKVEIKKFDRKFKQAFKDIDTTKTYSLVELIRLLHIDRRKGVDWLNSPTDGMTVDNFMRKLKADKFSQVLMQITATDTGLKKTARKSV